MDQLTRIASALERIAEALEKQDQSFNINSDTVIGPGLIDIKDGSLSDWKEAIDKYVAGGRAADAVSDKWLDTQKPYDTEIKYSTDATHLCQRCGVVYSVKVDDCRVPDTCEARFDTMINFGMAPHIQDDRHLSKEEAHALNRAVKRSTIKVHEGKLEKD